MAYGALRVVQRRVVVRAHLGVDRTLRKREQVGRQEAVEEDAGAVAVPVGGGRGVTREEGRRGQDAGVRVVWHLRFTEEVRGRVIEARDHAVVDAEGGRGERVHHRVACREQLGQRSACAGDVHEELEGLLRERVVRCVAVRRALRATLVVLIEEAVRELPRVQEPERVLPVQVRVREHLIVEHLTEPLEVPLFGHQDGELGAERLVAAGGHGVQLGLGGEAAGKVNRGLSERRR